jgi:hypothetical protein
MNFHVYAKTYLDNFVKSLYIKLIFKNSNQLLVIYF